MSDYVKTTNFAAKDSLPSGNAGKIVKGTEINTEFDNIATAVATKENAANKGAAGGYVGLDGSSNISAAGSITGASFIPTGSSVPANGVYLPSANTVGVASNTTLRASVNSTGNWSFAAPSSGVGITSTAPSGSSFAYRATSQAGSGNYGGMSFFASGAREYGIFALTTDGGLYVQDVTAGTSRAILGSSGNWQFNAPTSGIAMTVTGLSGSQALLINGPTNYAQAQFNDGTVAAYAGVGAFLNSSFNFGTSTAHGSTWVTNNASRVSINSAGNVTINAPSNTGSALNVAAGSAANWAAWTSGTAATSYMSFANAATRGYIGTDGGAIIGSGTGTNFGIRAENDLFLMSGATNRVTVNSTGNVSIAAPSSGTALTVSAASGSEIVKLSAGGATGTALALYDSGAVARGYIGIGTYMGGSVTNADCAIRASDALHLLSGGSASRMVIGSAGNVTINTPTSGTGLTIAGGGLAVTGAISQDGTALYTTGSFTGTLTGCTTSPTATINYAIVGNIVHLWAAAALTGTSNSVNCTITGAPVAIRPSASVFTSTSLMTDNSLGLMSLGLMSAAGTLTLYASAISGAIDRPTPGGFTASGTKGLQAGWYAAYPLI